MISAAEFGNIVDIVNKEAMNLPLKTSLKVLFCASELNPIVKVGGLGDVVGSLPKALKKLGLDVRVCIPFYKEINEEEFISVRIEKDILVPFGDYEEHVNIYQVNLEDVPVYLIRNKRFLSSGGIYFGSSAFVDSQAEIERFTFFSRAIIEFLKHFRWKSDIVHSHDWHTGIVSDLIKLERLDFATVFTIHNLANQGIWESSILRELQINKGQLKYIDWDIKDQNLDLILQGILGSSVISTVSPSYANEIMTPEYGEGLEDVLKAREGRVFGILNGIDVERFNPASDPDIDTPYTQDDFIEGKENNKIALQETLSLQKKDSRPLLGMVTRISEQKGFDILIPILGEIINRGFQFVLLGLGDKKYQEQIKDICAKSPKNSAAIYKFDAKLAQQIYAGADLFLMPSRFEPCGLGQMIAMRYGTVPIVRGVGGLKDSVKDSITGVVFSDYTPSAILGAVEKAGKIFKNKKVWQSIVLRAMEEDFSWDRSAKEYVKLYEKALGI